MKNIPIIKTLRIRESHVHIFLHSRYFNLNSCGREFPGRMLYHWDSRYIRVYKHCTSVLVHVITLQYTHVNVNPRLCIGECPSNSPFLKNNGTDAPKGPRPVVFKEWRDTRTFSNLKSTHCTLLILLIINLVTKKVCV